jgi:hypothetical protein
MKESYIKEVIKRHVYESKRGPRILDTGVIEFYRQFIDREICDVLMNADEIIIVGYSMPPYDFDFKSLLIKGLMPNKNRKNVPIHIITKAKGKELDNLIKRFEHLAGKVNVVSSKGFYKFLRDSSDTLARLLED